MEIPISQLPALPNYQKQEHHIYILLTSLNLGGAEKIVSDQLWANYYSEDPHKVTLIVIYEKEKEHTIPPNVNIVKLNNKIENGYYLFQQIGYQNKPLVCHLINDTQALYLFSFGIKIHLVIHNDKLGWSNSATLLNHHNIISLVAVCHYVKEQLQEVTNKKVTVFRHIINYKKYAFNQNDRNKIREKLHLNHDDIVIGMTGRICIQKNYFLAVDVLKLLVSQNPNYKLLILGGISADLKPLYIKLLKKITENGLERHVILPGFQTNAHEWMNAFDLAFNCSYFEGLSMATQELMFNGLPMIAAKVSGQIEIYDPLQQLDFFEFPKILKTPDTNNFSIVDFSKNTSGLVPEYLNLITIIAAKIENKINSNNSIQNQTIHSNQPKETETLERVFYSPTNINRFEFGEDLKEEMQSLCFGSHNLWSVLNFVHNTINKKEEENFYKMIAPLIDEEKELENKNNLWHQNQALSDQHVLDKTLFITQDLKLGGAQKSVVNLLSYFAEQGLVSNLCIVNQSPYATFLHQVMNKGVNCFVSHSSRNVFLSISNILHHIHLNKIEKVVFWNVDYKIKFLLAKFLQNVKMIDVSPGDYLFREMELNTCFEKGIYFSKEEYFNNIHHFVSKFDSRELWYETLKTKHSVIRNGVFIKDTENDITENTASKEKPNHLSYLKTDTFKVVVYGRIAHSKFVKEICAAFKHIKIDNFNFVLDIYGTAEEVYQEYYQDILNENKDYIELHKINLKGLSENPEKALPHYDLLITLGIYQGCPNTVLEGCAYQVPVISNNSGGTSEIINESTGILLETHFTQEQLINAITFAYYNQSIMQKKAKKAYEHIKNNFSMKDMAHQYLKLLHTV